MILLARSLASKGPLKFFVLLVDKQLMASKKIKKVNKKASPKDYQNFDKIDGHHPWTKAAPEGYIGYKARTLQRGEVVYFNFDLAKEMGLIPKDHPDELNIHLKKKLLDTFNLRIINEYDIKNKIKFSSDSIKENHYMATRYLQLQHKNKQGKTSGDGRGIWNGYFNGKGKTQWDVSSRGTGVTALAPGSVEADQPLKSGGSEYGYGCGLAEIDELYSSAIMAEILHKNGYNTERMLTIIDNGKGTGVGVRSGKNLLRPAHLFTFLKQLNYDALKKAVDYFIDRQYHNKNYSFSSKSTRKYNKLLDEVCLSFAKFTAYLERDYIFTWLDWDGDNVLIDAGIIDYGSIRQLGLRHDQYRYDDVDRFSTTLNEQKSKAKQIVQVFAQLTDYLQTKNKKPLKSFENHPILKNFTQSYEYHLLEKFLYQVGCTKQQRDYLLTHNKKLVKSLFNDFEFLEKQKIKNTVQLEDGVNKPALLNMRSALRELPKFLYADKNNYKLNKPNEDDFIEKIISEEANEKDKDFSSSVIDKIESLFDNYMRLLNASIQNKATNAKLKSAIKKLSDRSEAINKADRLTGNALIFVVNEIIKIRKKGLKQPEVQKIIQNIIDQQYLDPERKASTKTKLTSPSSKKLMKTILTIVDGHKEDI